MAWLASIVGVVVGFAFGYGSMRFQAPADSDAPVWAAVTFAGAAALFNVLLILGVGGAAGSLLDLVGPASSLAGILTVVLADASFVAGSVVGFRARRARRTSAST